MRLLLAIAAAAGLAAQAAGPQAVVRAQFSESRGLTEWELDGNGTWTMQGSVLILEKPGVPGGPIRRPAALAIFRSQPFTDLTLRAELRSTAPVDLAVRDVVVILGYRSPSEFYYAHLAAKTDAVHNGIFVVNQADRRRLDEPTSTARLTDQNWHRIRLERLTGAGTINVFFDDEKAPVLSATDRTFLSGRVGIGSFDETAEVRSFEVRGTTKAP
jgi:hypothetical protein